MANATKEEIVELLKDELEIKEITGSFCLGIYFLKVKCEDPMVYAENLHKKFPQLQKVSFFLNKNSVTLF